MAAAAKRKTQEDARSILIATADRENLVENAHNVVMERYHAKAKIRDDETQALDVREAAAEAGDIAKNYPALLQTEIDAYDRDALPTDLDALRRVLIERLEGISMRRTKEMKKASTQQGVDLGFSCVDEETVVRKIAKQCVLGRLAIRAAEDAIWVKPLVLGARQRPRPISPQSPTMKARRNLTRRSGQTARYTARQGQAPPRP